MAGARHIVARKAPQELAPYVRTQRLTPVNTHRVQTVTAKSAWLLVKIHELHSFQLSIVRLLQARRAADNGLLPSN